MLAVLEATDVVVAVAVVIDVADAFASGCARQCAMRRSLLRQAVHLVLFGNRMNGS